ncbi:hypothetical protein F5887DRAFT_1077197 [Amanita rubescens]|nr:hypothetical protein F5887DRAFT_1077197 [Amanita rubescens]
MDADTLEKDFSPVISVLLGSGISIVELITALLNEKQFKKHLLTKDLLENAKIIIQLLLSHTCLPDDACDMACVLAEPMYAHEIRALADKSDWHFGAQQAVPDDIEDFGLNRMAEDFSKTAPRVWALLDALLKARKRKTSLLLQSAPVAVDTGDTDELFDLDEARLEGSSQQGSISRSPHAQEANGGSEKRSGALLQIKKTVLVSMMMQSSNQKANTLASILGIFLHSCCTPQKVINALARMGLSISRTTIHSAINLLSSNMYHSLRELGETRCLALAYDNFDVDLKISVPVVEKAGDTLKHLTSGLVFLLQHGTKPEDLRYSEYLWVNYLAREPSELNSRDEFNAWVFLCDLLENVEGFEYLQSEVGQPNIIEQIPVVKTDIFPVYAMDVNNSTISGNIQAIEQLMQQVGYGGTAGDDQDTVDVSEYVVPVHGDLGTGERISSIQDQWAIEKNLWERFQYVKFCPGYFHVKMAAVDAVWHIAIKPQLGRKDETCMMKDIGIIRPRETGTITSKCEFCHMHQVAGHVGIAQRLDCWRIVIQRKFPEYDTLEDFAKLKPGLDELKTLASELSQEFVANDHLKYEHFKSIDERDQQFENAKLILLNIELYL